MSNRFNAMMRNKEMQNDGFTDFCKECNEILPEPQHYTEIGAWKGESAVIASNYFKKITSIDPYPNENMSVVREEYLKNTKHIQDCTLIEQTSDTAVKLFDNMSIDVLYIDGDHTYEGCKKDVELWWPKLRVGGLFSGHDYKNRPRNNKEAKRAVDEYFDKLGITVNKTMGERCPSFWWIKE